MAQCTYKQKLNAPAAEAWALFSRFGEVDWLPGPERVETVGQGPGMKRLLYIPTVAAPVEETLASIDERNREYAYRVKKNIFVPYDDYRARVKVEEAAGGCLITIQSTFALAPSAIEAAGGEAAAEQAAQQSLSAAYQMMVGALGRALGAA